MKSYQVSPAPRVEWSDFIFFSIAVLGYSNICSIFPYLRVGHVSLFSEPSQTARTLQTMVLNTLTDPMNIGCRCPGQSLFLIKINIWFVIYSWGHFLFSLKVEKVKSYLEWLSSVSPEMFSTCLHSVLCLQRLASADCFQQMYFLVPLLAFGLACHRAKWQAESRKKELWHLPSLLLPGHGLAVAVFLTEGHRPHGVFSSYGPKFPPVLGSLSPPFPIWFRRIRGFPSVVVPPLLSSNQLCPVTASRICVCYTTLHCRQGLWVPAH